MEVYASAVGHILWIKWMELVSDKGIQRKYLNPDEDPKHSFHISDEKPLVVYA